MKKVIFALILVFAVFFGINTYADNTASLLHGTATGDNVTMDFDDTNTSTAAVLINSFTGNACGTDYSGFLLTGHVNRSGNGYVYFAEDDGDDTVDSCVAVILSGKDFILTGVAHTDSDDGAKMTFNNIKLNYSNSDKVFYFSGEAIDDHLGSVPHWDTVYVSGLNLIDWSKTIVDYSNLTGGNYIANGNSTGVNVLLEDVGGNPVNVINKITVEVTSTSSNLSGYTFLSGDDTKKLTLDVSNGIVNIPMYILKAVDTGSINLNFSYDVADMDGNTSHTVALSNIKTKKPVSNIDLSISGTSIVGEDTTGSFNISYVNNNQGKINFITITGTTSTVSSYNLKLLSSSDTGFIAKVYPKNSNITFSKINSTYNISSYTLGFSNFSDVKVVYSVSTDLTFTSYADKRVDYSKSFTGLGLNNQFTGGNINNTLEIKPILRDKNGYRIPDIEFNLKIEDAGIANSYTGWDCNEIDSDYQDSCNDLQFSFDGNIYSGNIDSVEGTTFNYQNSDSIYSGVKVISYKPVTGGKLKFDITDLKNTISSWDFTDSGDYLKLPSNYSGYISNIVFKPFLNIRLAGLDDEENYVDINNDIYLKLDNISQNNLSNISYDLSGEVTKPSDGGVSFATGGLLSGNNLNIDLSSQKNLLQTIMFSLAYRFNGDIKFNYNHGYYSYTLNGVGSLKLKPWSFYFNLGGTYKLGGAFVNGLVNKTQKYSSTVKSVVGGQHATISAKFSRIYNILARKATILTRGLAPEQSNTIDPSNLAGGLKYYECGSTDPVVVVETGTYAGSNTLILKNCKLVIEGNITKSNNSDNLIFFLYDNKPLNLSSENYLDRVSNIYINSNVSDIYAGLFTKGSIITLKGNYNSSDLLTKILVDNRTHVINDRQLYINGSLLAKDNVGGSFLVKGKNQFTIGGSRKVYKTDSFWGKTSMSFLRNIAQIFDINFWRGFKYSGPNTIDSNWYSYYCNKGDNKQPGCKYPVYIQFDPAIKNNMLFK